MMWSVIILLVVGLFQLFQNPKSSMVSDKMPFSEFLKNIDDGRVVQVEIKGNDIQGILSDGTTFNTYAPNDPNLVEKLASKGVSITALPLEDKMPSLLGILLSWFPMLLLIGVWVFFMRQMQGGKGGAMGFGKSKAKLLSEARGLVTFNDVAGIDEAKEEVEEKKTFKFKLKQFKQEKPKKKKKEHGPYSKYSDTSGGFAFQKSKGGSGYVGAYNSAELDGETEIEEKKSATGYELYHKDFSSAMQHAYDHAKSKGFVVDPKEIDDKVATGPKKPSSGKVNRYSLKAGRKKVEIQVTNLDNKRYELNMYIEGVELTEALKPLDKAVIDAFYYKKEKEGKVVSTDGDSLWKNGLGGQEMAIWNGRKIKITGATDSKSTESILKYMKKSIPSGLLEAQGFNQWIKEVKINEKEKFAGWIAFYNKDKLEIKPKKGVIDSLNDAKQAAIKHFKVPKSKQGLLAIEPAYEEFKIDEKKSATGYELYHKTFSDAMQHAYAHAKSKGFVVDPKEIDDKVATGPKKPSSGKTNRYSLKAGRKKGWNSSRKPRQ